MPAAARPAHTAATQGGQVTSDGPQHPPRRRAGIPVRFEALVRFAVLFETEGPGCFPHSAYGRQCRFNCGDYNTTSTQKYNLSSPSGATRCLSIAVGFYPGSRVIAAAGGPVMRASAVPVIRPLQPVPRPMAQLPLVTPS